MTILSLAPALQQVKQDRRCRRNRTTRPTTNNDEFDRVVLGKDLFVRAMNPAAENLLGFSSSRAAGQAFLSLVENDGTLAAVLDQALVNNVTFAYDTMVVEV